MRIAGCGRSRSGLVAVCVVGTGVVAGLVVAIAESPAATVRIDGDEGLYSIGYAARSGELNGLTVSAVARPTITYFFTERATTVRPLARGIHVTAGDCVRGASARQARCVLGPGTSSQGVAIRLGDRNDTARVSGAVYTEGAGPASGKPATPYYQVFGGAGNDAIAVGANARGQLFGSFGSDRLSGGSSADRLVGGPGNDRMLGGGGVDVTSYADHATGVRVDLRRTSPQGSRSERDFLFGIESVIGGRGGDVLIGNTAPNTIDARGGNDALNVAGGGADIALCGPGVDTVRADVQDRLVGCERVIRGG